MKRGVQPKQRPRIPRYAATLHLTLKDVATLAGCSPATLTRVVKGEVSCSVDLAIKIAKVLRQPVEVLF